VRFKALDSQDRRIKRTSSGKSRQLIPERREEKQREERERETVREAVSLTASVQRPPETPMLRSAYSLMVPEARPPPTLLPSCHIFHWTWRGARSQEITQRGEREGEREEKRWVGERQEELERRSSTFQRTALGVRDRDRKRGRS